MELGYALSSEEHTPNKLIRHARRAEEIGFTYALISDHFHPWVGRQGESPFVWCVIGGIAQATKRLRLGTGVTCPIMRLHPALVAQAAATAATMMPGRFFLGLGTGENLNEHILGQHWPPTAVRQDMLEEAVGIIRRLWQGGVQSWRGAHFTVENAQIYTLPETLPPIYIAASGEATAQLAARIADGLINSSSGGEPVRAYAAAGGHGPRYGQLTVCWARTEDEARRTAREWWPIVGLKGALHSELPLPVHFEQAGALVTEEAIGEAMVCGPDPEKHWKAIQEFVDAGYDHVYVHQVGPDQDGFFDFYEREILTQVEAMGAS